MSVETDPLFQQTDFRRGPNYTASPYDLQDGELAESANVWWDKGLQGVPGAARVAAGQLAAAKVERLMEYRNASGTQQLLAVHLATGGATTTVQRSTLGFAAAWTSVATGLTNSGFWDWDLFNNLLITTSETNAPKSWDGTTWQNLAGSPPAAARCVVAHGDFVFLAGHSGSEIRYSDTSTAIVWPSGNVLRAGIDTGELIYGLHRLGERTLVWLDDSIWYVEGNTPDDFVVLPTPSAFGSRYTNSIVQTPQGYFFWSDNGPAWFDGVKSHVLNARLRRHLDTVDWSNTSEAMAAYDPYTRRVAFTFLATGDSHVDGGTVLWLDLVGFNPEAPVFWPMTWKATTLETVNDAQNRNRLYFGTGDGYVLAMHSGTTYNTADYAPRARFRYLHQGADRTHEDRRVAALLTANGGTVTAKYGVNGVTTLTAHGSAQATTAAGQDSLQLLWQGDGLGYAPTGHTTQWELTGSTSAFGLQALSVVSKELGRR